MKLHAAVALIFVALAAPASAEDRPLPPTILTAFDPLVDGMAFENDGTRVRPFGTCYGMSLLAIDNYARRVASRGQALPNRITYEAKDGYLIEQLTASAAQKRLSQQTLSSGINALGFEEPVIDALRRIETTGEPEVLAFYNATSGHAVVLTGWSKGALHIYDPNFPGETIEWPFDPEVGLGPHPKAATHGGLYADMNELSVKPVSELDPNRELQLIREQCDSGAAACYAGMLPVSEVAHEVAADGGLVITGRVGEWVPNTRVWAVVDNQPVGAMAPVNPDGTFEVIVPPGMFDESSRVQLALTTTGSGREQLSGFADVMNGPPTPGEEEPTAVTQREERPPTPTPTRSDPQPKGGSSPGLIGALDRALKPR